ncbi:PepSY domain-containing protein [Luteimonas sp. BDR2-5]|uniref:NADH:ubiquinone reductase (Na(+)-transporting) subunit F n=1 Tax=Proluteimonas luteida TaxID=2878685 RepID=UPI001E2B7273|nr:2Fe-2S iron-sulfur cluster binding domain-containing protein [Luteimonas sp. BDR2-5]MCD9028253.1 PepSY domain-containing protein [Luteimonas sp. BDR2-5]
MTPWLRRLHRWVGLLVAIQFVLWMASGLMMGWLDHDRVQGHTWRAHPAGPAAWPQDALPAEAVLAAAAASGPVGGVSSAWLGGTPVYRIVDDAGTRLVDARSGAPLTPDPARVLRLAEASYTGPGRAGTPRLVERTLETRSHPGAVWRVDFDDADDTTAYLSAETGEVLVHRNRTWRLFDIFWMLHIMDYTGRSDFNNPLVVTAGFGGLWMALSGIWLLVASFRVGEFVPRRWRPARSLAVFAPNGERLRTVTAAAGDTAYVALARSGLQLPSNCGGGQSCGLCEVRVRGRAPAPSAADRAHLPDTRLRVGHRLACGLPLRGDAEIEVAGGAALWTAATATVEHVEAITPLLREFVLRPEMPAGPDYQPGAYLQLHIPAYELPADALVWPEAHHGDRDALALPPTLRNREPARRAYSLSLAPAADDGRLRLLVRFTPGGGRGRRHPPGKGSSWLYALRPGDRVRYSGPFGDFALQPGGREKVFIGGGAGMAPLRAMIRDLLDRGAEEPIHFWYGARSLRDAPFVEEMRRLATAHANFHWHLVLSETVPDESGRADGCGALHGLVHEAAARGLLEAHPALQACDFYLCGPPAMLAATRRMLAAMGIAADRVAYDDFKI